MSSSYAGIFLRGLVTIFLFPVGWGALVAAVILINASFKYLISTCSNFLSCLGDKLISTIQSQNFLGEICIALIVGAIVVLGRLLGLWLQGRRSIL